MEEQPNAHLCVYTPDQELHIDVIVEEGTEFVDACCRALRAILTLNLPTEQSTKH